MNGQDVERKCICYGNGIVYTYVKNLFKKKLCFNEIAQIRPHIFTSYFYIWLCAVCKMLNWTQVNEHLHYWTGLSLEYAVPESVPSACRQLSQWLELRMDPVVNASLQKLQICASEPDKYMIWEADKALTDVVELFQLRESYMMKQLDWAETTLALALVILLIGVSVCVLGVCVWRRYRRPNNHPANEDGWYWIGLGREGEQGMFDHRRMQQ